MANSNRVEIELNEEDEDMIEWLENHATVDGKRVFVTLSTKSVQERTCIRRDTAQWKSKRLGLE